MLKHLRIAGVAEGDARTVRRGYVEERRGKERRGKEEKATNAEKQEANEGETARREIRSERAALRASWKRGCVAERCGAEAVEKNESISASDRDRLGDKR